MTYYLEAGVETGHVENQLKSPQMQLDFEYSTGKTLKAVESRNTSFSLGLADSVYTWTPKAGTAC